METRDLPALGRSDLGESFYSWVVACSLSLVFRLFPIEIRTTAIFRAGPYFRLLRQTDQNPLVNVMLCTTEGACRCALLWVWGGRAMSPSEEDLIQQSVFLVLEQQT